MDGFTLVLWGVRLLFLAPALPVPGPRDPGPAARPAGGRPRAGRPARPPGRPRLAGRRAGGRARRSGSTSITPLGRDVNNAIVIDDPFASAEHAVLTYRGRSWYLEDLGSTNGSYVNGQPVEGVAALGYGDELQIGQVRFRLERTRA